MRGASDDLPTNWSAQRDSALHIDGDWAHVCELLSGSLQLGEPDSGETLGFRQATTDDVASGVEQGCLEGAELVGEDGSPVDVERHVRDRS